MNNELEKIKHSYLASKQKLKISQDKLKTILTTLNGNQNIKPTEHPLYLKHMSKLNQIKFKAGLGSNRKLKELVRARSQLQLIKLQPAV